MKLLVALQFYVSMVFQSVTGFKLWSGLSTSARIIRGNEPAEKSYTIHAALVYVPSCQRL
jgi:hypothetical protein